jgi:hypothetical protein
MENLDIVILSTIVTTLFVVFGVYTYKEFKYMGETTYTGKERGPRADMINFVGRLFDDNVSKKMSNKEKEIIYKNIKRTISDMESDGVRFPEEVKEELKKKRDELLCEYSGLPSVKSYDIKNVLK